MNYISDDIIISKKCYECYLMHTPEEYYLFKPDNDEYTVIKIDINENPCIVENTLINDTANGKISNNPVFNGSLMFLKLHLEMIGLNDDKQNNFIQTAFYDLAEVYEEYADRLERFNNVTDEKIINDIETISKEIDRNKKDSVIGELYTAFKNRKGVKKAIRDLGNYLNKEHGIILRKQSHEPYKLDPNIKGYDSIDYDEIIALLIDVIGEDNLISTADVENAIDFISERLSPTPNIVKFNNGLYDMKQHQIIKPENPIFTLVESPHNYNPEAKGEQIQEFLNTSFEREDPTEKDDLITGVLQVIGYLFTSGNPYNVLIFFTGISGAGKGTLELIIGDIFRGKTCNVDLSKISNNNNDHTASAFINSHLNLVGEGKKEVVYDITEYKALSGNDPYPVNPKFKPPYLLAKEEVPKTVIANNNLPTFINPDDGLLQRFIVIEFKNKFRNTDKDKKGLADLIINSADDMEWLIYHGLEAYKEMVEADDDFILRLSEKETAEIIFKHSKPLNYLIRKLILKHDKEAYESEVETYAEDNEQTVFTRPYILTNELNQLIMYLANKEGVQLTLDKNGKVSGKMLLNVIKDEFDLHDYYIEPPANSSKKSPIEYKTIVKKIDKQSVRVYPELIKTDEYTKLLEELLKEIDEKSSNTE